MLLNGDHLCLVENFTLRNLPFAFNMKQRQISSQIPFLKKWYKSLQFWSLYTDQFYLAICISTRRILNRSQSWINKTRVYTAGSDWFLVIGAQEVHSPCKLERRKATWEGKWASCLKTLHRFQIPPQIYVQVCLLCRWRIYMPHTPFLCP